jgi:hypothetical protein
LQLQKLDAERTKLEQSRQGLLGTAKTELLAKGKDVIEHLAALGFTYKFSASVAGKSHKTAPKTTTKSKVRRRSTQTVCPICHWGRIPRMIAAPTAGKIPRPRFPRPNWPSAV